MSGFMGFVRADGRVGTRNHIGVFVAGNCAATAARRVADWFTPKRLAAYANVDHVVPFIHELGCGMEKSGEPMDLLRRTLGGGIRNPNIGAALVLALGCERNNIYAFLQQEGLAEGSLLKTVVLQEVGGTAKAIEAGIAAIQEMLPLVNATARKPVSLHHLSVGLQVGDDALGSLQAQKALGAAVDRLVADGGTVIVSGTTLAAPTLSARATDGGVRDQLTSRIHWWQEHAAGRDTRAARAPAAAHSLPFTGQAEVQSVVGYAHPLQSRGLVFMDSPVYEAISASGQVASGANLVCVLTASGSAFEAPAVPTLKLATDVALLDQMPDDLDLACGTQDAATEGQRIYEAWLACASGKPTQGEELGVGTNEFVPWPIGVLA